MKNQLRGPQEDPEIEYISFAEHRNDPRLAKDFWQAAKLPDDQNARCELDHALDEAKSDRVLAFLIKKIDLGPKTRKEYGAILSKFKEYSPDLKLDDAAGFLARVSGHPSSVGIRGGLAPGTLKKYRCVIQSFLSHTSGKAKSELMLLPHPEPK